MDKFSCSIIRDLLPLYCDDVCSPESKKMIEEHLQTCETCSDMLCQMKCEYKVDSREIAGDKGKGAVLEKMSRGWKQSILKAACKAFLTGMVSMAIVLAIFYGVHYTLFEYQGDMVEPEQVHVDIYRDIEKSENQIAIRIQPVDGYCGGNMVSYVDEDRNMYISIQRTIVKEHLPDGEDEVMIYGFDQTQKKYNAVYYGEPENCRLLWKSGDHLPDAASEVF